jgi:hypothetical protein
MPETIEIEPGVVLRVLSAVEASALADAWLEVFAKHRRGANTKAYLWHTFSANRYPSITGKEALAQYEQQIASEYIVLSNERDLAFVTDKRPTKSYLSDWYVFPVNFAWTMAFTHEDGWLGPYFARHERFSELNRENELKIRKAREAEAAKLKGWR